MKTIEERVGEMVDAKEGMLRAIQGIAILICYEEANYNLERNKSLPTDSNILHEMLNIASKLATNKVKLEMNV